MCSFILHSKAFTLPQYKSDADRETGSEIRVECVNECLQSADSSENGKEKLETCAEKINCIMWNDVGLRKN